MCGIAGILSKHQDLGSDDAQHKLAAMQSALAHRGPDGAGVYLSPMQTAALCHTRLAIIDLSASGAQPMQSQHGRYTITFNGEIYNYPELKQKLQADGVAFSSDSDTEVLLKLYEAHGPQFVHQLRGMFAFLIWDEATQTAFAARDPFGIKPFYYVDNKDGVFAFSSEVRSLIKADLVPKNPCYDGLKSFLKSGTVAEPHTLIANVHQLPAGHSLVWQNGDVSINTYWKIAFPHQKVSREDAVRRTRAALESTVKAHFVSDVPVGIFLSGGIDSSALVAVASKVTDAQINTYSIAFESPQWNEADIAQKVSQQFGTKHTEFLITPQRAKPLFADFLNVIDQPTIDGFNTYCVAKLASDAGEKVVLSGVGGDELFAGYQSFEQLPKMLGWAKRLSILKPLFAWLNNTGLKRINSKQLRILDFLQHPPSVQTAHQSLRGIFSEQEALALLQTLNIDNRHKTRVDSPPTFDHTADQISHQELTTYMRNQLLRDSDVMSMACGLELRVPFVDRVFFEELAIIPAQTRLQYGKQLLIDAVPELPEYVVNRPKQGFRFPFDEWFAEDWRDLDAAQQAILEAPQWLALTPWYRRWALVVLNHWLQRHEIDVH